MTIDSLFNSKSRGIVAMAALLIILCPVGFSLVAGVLSGGSGEEPFLEMPDAKHERCVRDTVFMRFNHMYLLMDIRDNAMREGIRGEIGLYSCRECHTSREKFCDRCHDAVNLYPGCFECHYYPQ